MPAQRLDFSKSSCGNRPCEQGATFFQELTWEKQVPAGSDTYIPVDISGYTAKMQVRKDAGSPVVVELSTANGKITIDGPNGKITLRIEAADTNLIPAGMYKYDLELTDGGGFVTRFVQGAFEVVGQITL